MTDDTTHYYFVMDEAKQRSLLQNVSDLRLGELRVDVISRLGPPTYDRADVTKEGKLLGRSVIYYLKIWQRGVVNEKRDSFINLNFDVDDHLTRISRKVDATP